MSVKIQPEDHYLAKLDEYLTDQIGRKDFVIELKGYLYTTLMLYLNSDDLEGDKASIIAGYYHLNKLIEILES